MARTLACLFAVLSLTAVARTRRAPPGRERRVDICGPIIKPRAHVLTLFERKEIQLPSMITTPRRFRSELLDRD